jgi:hypothetical protein
MRPEGYATAVGLEPTTTNLEGLCSNPTELCGLFLSLLPLGFLDDGRDTIQDRSLA